MGNWIASSGNPSGFSFGTGHRESDIHSMIGTTPRVRPFVLLPQIRRALDSPPLHELADISNAVRHCCFRPQAYYPRFRFNRQARACTYVYITRYVSCGFIGYMIYLTIMIAYVRKKIQCKVKNDKKINFNIEYLIK